MKCPNCGTNNKEGMKFCKICGCELPEDHFDSKGIDERKPRRRSPKWLVIAIVVVAAAIVGVVAFLLVSQFMNKADTDSEEDNENTSVIETTIIASYSHLETTVPPTTKETTQATTEAILKIPNVEGMKSNDAYKKISDLGLKYKAEFEYSSNVPEDYVISQSPSEDKKANVGDTVSLIISRGEKPATSSDYSNSSRTNESSSNISSSGDTTDQYGLNVSSRYISRSDISWMSLDEIQMAINEVYAKLGFRFTKPPYSTYFGSMDWYHPDTQDMNVIEKRMNKYEYENMKVMGTYRDSLSN